MDFWIHDRKFNADELVEILATTPEVLTDVLVTIAGQLVIESDRWCKNARVELDAGAAEYAEVLEHSREFYAKAVEVAQAAMDLDAFAAEVGAFD